MDLDMLGCRLIDQILGEPEVDSVVDCVGFEARGHGGDAETDRQYRHSLACTLPRIRARPNDAAKTGNLSIRFGLGWARSCGFATGQCPVMFYNRQLMMAILHDKVIGLDEAPQGYKDFDQGAAKKFIIDPHNCVA